jgi:hypothetical protein
VRKRIAAPADHRQPHSREAGDPGVVEVVGKGRAPDHELVYIRLSGNRPSSRSRDSLGVAEEPELHLRARDVLENSVVQEIQVSDVICDLFEALLARHPEALIFLWSW